VRPCENEQVPISLVYLLDKSNKGKQVPMSLAFSVPVGWDAKLERLVLLSEVVRKRAGSHQSRLLVG
jgi:hypothetical protein